MAIEARPDSSKVIEFFLPASRRSSPVTLELFDTISASSRVESPLSLGWQSPVDLKKGRAFYKHNQNCVMKGKEKHHRVKPKLELKLNLSPSKDSGNDDNSIFSRPSPSSYLSSPPSGTSTTSSCITTEVNSENRTVPEENQNQKLDCCRSPEAISMVLVGCPGCLMYVMLSHARPECPRCKSTCLLDFQQKTSNKTKTF